MTTNINTQKPTNLITQVNKEDTNQSQQMMDTTGLFKCCNFLWKCFPFRKQSFSPISENGLPSLLAPQPDNLKGRKVLVLDLDETLVHSTFEPVANADIILPVHIGKQKYEINVMVRPGTEEFLAKAGEYFEVVVFTASLPEYAEPLVKLIDKTQCVTSLLYRQHCTHVNGIYVKDMTLMGRNIKDIILVDNSPNSFLFQPENAYHIKNFFDDKTDTELQRLTDFLHNILNVDDVRPISEHRNKYENKEVQVTRTSIFSKSLQIAEQQQCEIEVSTININIPRRIVVKTMAAEEMNRNYIESEPDLRKQDDGDFPYAHRGNVTERVSGDKSLGQGDESSSGEIELPISPKESDNLINHRDADAFYDNDNNNSSDSTVKEKKVHTGTYKSLSKFNNDTKQQKNISTGIEDSTLVEANKIDTVRFLDNGLNLNSPIGKPTKIIFNNNMNNKDVALEAN